MANNESKLLNTDLGAEPAAPAARPVKTPKPADKQGWWWGTGRRKTAVARVRIRPIKDGAEAKIQVLSYGRRTRTIEQYFTEERDRADVMFPLKLTGTAGKFDVWVRVQGGGTMGQAQAVRLGIARALNDYDPVSFDRLLRDNSLLTRDAREVERKKYGQAGARRRFQFSKR